MIELKNCPFCNYQAEIISDSFGVMILCDNCKSSGGIWETEEEALEKWNTRMEANNDTSK